MRLSETPELFLPPTLPFPLPDIIRRYSNGESMQTLAAELNVSRMTLYNWLLTGLGDADYHDLITRCLVRRIADADAELDTARSKLDIARAATKMRYFRSDFERRRPALYGQKREITGSHTVTVTVDRGSAIERNPPLVRLENTSQNAEKPLSERSESMSAPSNVS